MSERVPIIAVLAGGTSAEREVSLGSGTACAMALSRIFPTQFFQVDGNAVPAGVDPARHVVFSTLHGTFGEDGGMQRLLDEAGISYAGCDATSSAFTMDKSRTKKAVAERGVRVAKGICFSADKKPPAPDVIRELGERVVVKPNAEGSSVGLSLPEGTVELEKVLGEIRKGDWLIEERLDGRELSVGVVDGLAMGVVEIRPKSGVYDYASKYTKGMSEYIAPAQIGEMETDAVKKAAETAFAACGCRDYARVDFILSGEGIPFLLEINTLPGMKETSLLPMSARCCGLDFTQLTARLVAPAVERFYRNGGLA